MTNQLYSKELINQLNEDIKHYPVIHKIKPFMKKTYKGVSRLVMLDRYAFKDTAKLTFKEGDFVVLTAQEDPKFPVRGLGIVTAIDWENRKATVQLEKEFWGKIKNPKESETGIVVRAFDLIDKPLELFYEQIAARNATGLSAPEKTEEKRKEWFNKFYDILVTGDLVPAGRVLYGAGSGTEVTYFNCYVMPFMKDSRGGISDHRKQVMEIMSRGGGVGTNGSTLRPRGSVARSVNGKASGTVSWMDDLAKLTHLVEQGGSRRGAQMIMLNDWHPDIYEFIISKMQNPRILRYLIENTEDEEIKTLAENKLKFTEFTDVEKSIYKSVLDNPLSSPEAIKVAKQKLNDGGLYQVNNPEFLTGANISICLTKEFMEAVENDADYTLKFPDVENYSDEEMKFYNENWHECGDVREWETKYGMRVKKYRTIKAKELWSLINVCATYSAEPGIFFLDNANEKTNAVAYGQKVVATNPCGEQPLAPFSVCNLAAINLANFANRKTKEVDYERLSKVVKDAVRLQDNVIDATPYFLKENEKQALGERRVGLGVMGLHDLLIYCGVGYGSEEGNEIVDKVFECMATSAYRASIEIGKEKGSFPFLNKEDGEFDLDKRRAFINSGYMKDMPEDIREDILHFGIRNSHLLTVAPTGSTGTMVGVSTGLEPYFSFDYYRSGRLGKHIRVISDIALDWLKDNGYEVTEDNVDDMMEKLPEQFVSSMELSPEQHADVQCIIQRWVDSSLSKTVNAPRGYTVEQVENVYERLYKGGAKGGTVYVDGSRDSQVLTLKAEDNTFEDDLPLSDKKEKVELTHLTVSVDLDHFKDKKVGTSAGDICPECRAGTIEELGGCHTCTNCKIQVSCGL
jgi:ribonucleoside-diphosphate reductase alpha chain